MPSVYEPSSSEPAALLDQTSVTTTDGRITAPALVDAGWLVEHRSAVTLIDTRSSRDFASGHVPGAVSLPLDSLLVEDSSRPAVTRLAILARTVLSQRGVAPTDHVALVDGCDGSAALGALIWRAGYRFRAG
jgi:rhodanese-related sulfurtransferase